MFSLVSFMVFNATFNNISVILWLSLHMHNVNQMCMENILSFVDYGSKRNPESGCNEYILYLYIHENSLQRISILELNL